MDRRQYLQVLAGAGTAVAAGYGAYNAVLGSSGPDDDSGGVRVEPIGGMGGGDDVDDRGDGTVGEDETRDGDVLLGVTPSTAELGSDSPFERWLGKRHAVVGSFVDVGIPDAEIEWNVYERLQATWESGHVPHVFWQPFFGSREDTGPDVTREVADGEHDESIQAWAETLAEWAVNEEVPDRRLYLNLAPEMTGDWSPWSPATGDSTEADYVDMWRRMHDVVTEAGLGPTHVRWVWTIDNTNRGVDVDAVYPGDDYVDWASIHGYNWANWGGWRSPEEVYADAIETVRSVTDKPLALTELACSSETVDSDHDPRRKDRWIGDAYGFLVENDVRMALWFNFSKETDWAVFDAEYGVETVSVDGESYAVYPQYRRSVGDPGMLPTHPTNPRLLTDEEFAGTF